MATSGVLYWDASAVLSVLCQDDHADAALTLLEASRTNLLSSLTWAEVHSVLNHMLRLQGLTPDFLALFSESLERPIWTKIFGSPDWVLTKSLASRWALKGADLWHLAEAKTLQQEVPEIKVVTFDVRLQTATAGEGLLAF